MDAIYQWDVELFRLLHLGYRPLWLDHVMQAVTDMGLGHVQLVALFALWLRSKSPWATWGLIALGILATLLVEKRPHSVVAMAICVGLFWRVPDRVCLWAFFAAAAAGIVRLGVKELVQRERPSNFGFAEPLEPIFSSTSSFPSGHSTTSFAIGCFLALALFRLDQKALAWLCIAWSALTGISRVYVGVHYPTDVLAAAGLGCAVASGLWLWKLKRIAVSREDLS